MRTVLQTDTLAEHAGAPPADTTTWVRWLQTGLWHGDLRVPDRALMGRAPLPLAHQSPAQLAALAEQQGYAGVTQVERQPSGEVCTWLRFMDIQPPTLHPDAGWLLFEAPDRLVEVGIHQDYNEVWERLPGSGGRFVALGGLTEAGQDDGRRLLLAGQYLMRVRPRRVAWPKGMPPGYTLVEALMTQPDMARDWLDFEISFGRWVQGEWLIERSSLPEFEGVTFTCSLQRLDERLASVCLPERVEEGPVGTPEPSVWQILEWDDPRHTLD